MNFKSVGISLFGILFLVATVAVIVKTNAFVIPLVLGSMSLGCFTAIIAQSSTKKILRDGTMTLENRHHWAMALVITGCPILAGTILVNTTWRIPTILVGCVATFFSLFTALVAFGIIAAFLATTTPDLSKEKD